MIEKWRQNPKMPSNVEIKAKVEDFVKVVRKAKELSASEGEVIEQRDVFFIVPHGRLKVLSRKDVFCILWVKQEYTVMKLKVWDILWN